MFTNFDWIGAMRASPVMVALLVCSIVTFGFALERALYYWRRRAGAERTLMEAVDQARAGHVKEAAFRCSTAVHPAGPVAAEVLRSQHLGPEVQEERMQIALSEQRLLF